ncbi:hypothetical protein RJ639_040620 [Escallonia herrerae]|uniref:Rx N-terminal domain-containing protein n=1 Tax=Escallonia herrerae TaxID=1293975 RepID=A0AA88WHA6_9ASTE|nr:hypothetical protein RJ639_040620 [Escallonia herrerae]
MVVTEIFISTLVTVLFEKLASGELLNLARRQGIYSHIETWSLTLEKVEAVLGDAEEKQITDKSVNKWLEQLQDLAYDLDDILDELATEALGRKLMQESQTSTSNLRRLVPACCTASNFSPRVVKFDFKMKSKIDSITTRLQDLVKQKNELSLSVHVGGSSLKRTGHERLPTTSLVDESGRSLFQCSSSHQSRFLMHDLLNDLAQHVAGRICFRLDNKTESNMRHSVFLQKARHSSFIRHEYEVFQRFEAFNRAPNLRTFLPLPVSQTSQGFYLTKQVSSDLLPQLLCLRVLSFSGYSIRELPNSIGNLKHLRYLNLSDTRVKQLPESVSELYNLQTLALRCCKELAKLPQNTRNLINLRHLDIAGTSQLKVMPLGIGKLTSLQTLSKIVLDRSRGLRVNELRGLSNLRGALSIIGLQSVMKVQDAVEANLLRKQGLNELEMEWGSGFDGFKNKRTEKEVFDVLKPSTNLRALKVESYGGIEFPSWLGDPSFSSLACMTLCGCKECISLPSLGHLPSLKELRIKGMDGVKSVGAELCGIISPQVKVAFPALTVLEFDNMVGLVEWSTSLSNDVENVRPVFPSLRELRLSDCPNLIRVSLPRLPSLRVLNISQCHEVVLTSVVALASAITTLRIRGISGLSQLHEGVLQFLGKSLEVLLIYGCHELITLWEGEHACENLAGLRNLEVGNCFGLVSLLGEDEQELPQNLERLELWYCKNLGKLPDGLKSLKSLRALIIGGCPRLDFILTTTELEVQSSINNDDKYENALMERFSRLETFEIQDCPSMTIFPLGQNISTTLKTLRVKDCKNLEPDSETVWLLKGTMPSSSLVNIDIRGWENLKLLPGNLLRFVHLTGLHISACLSLESFPKNVALPPRLVNLSIGNCRNLKYLLPDDHYQMQSLASLLYLNIYDCPSLELFPRRCWPPNLESLRLGGDFMRPSSGWEPQRLPTSLSRLILFGGSSGDDLYSSLVLHNHSLTTLEIKEFSYLEKLLPNGLQNLNSLEHLWISACPKLRCLPDTLLPGLSGLYIRDCPLLKGRCLREKRDYWPMISRIPFVKIDHVLL